MTNEIKKLEIKHIAPYLPYGLKWYHSNKSGTHPITLYNANTIIHAVNNQNYKIVLRPMSDLYKERNGKIDIVELAKVAGITGAIYPFEHSLGFGYKYKDTFRWDEDGFIFEFHDLDDSFPVSNQIGLFEYLFANHYDIFGLIDKGLAIDKNTIKEWKKI